MTSQPHESDGYRADLQPVQALAYALGDVLAEVEDRRRGDREAIQRLEALRMSLAELGTATEIRARVRDELEEIIEILKPFGPIALADAP